MSLAYTTLAYTLGYTPKYSPIDAMFDGCVAQGRLLLLHTYWTSALFLCVMHRERERERERERARARETVRERETRERERETCICILCTQACRQQPWNLPPASSRRLLWTRRTHLTRRLWTRRELLVPLLRQPNRENLAVYTCIFEGWYHP